MKIISYIIALTTATIALIECRNPNFHTIVKLETLKHEMAKKKQEETIEKLVGTECFADGLECKGGLECRPNETEVQHSTWGDNYFNKGICTKRFPEIKEKAHCFLGNNCAGGYKCKLFVSRKFKPDTDRLTKRRLFTGYCIKDLEEPVDSSE